ncbi:MAG: protein kinase [Acidobacteriota bacterium]|jgi:serine/threonine protein kinase/WD40 repeat protein
MLSREERILTELLVSRGLVTSERLEERVDQHQVSPPQARLVDILVSEGDLDRETGRQLAEEARDIDGGMAPELAPGDRLGEFTLVGEIGRGGMGVVYEAEQESLRRRVALKVLPAEAARDERLVLRFLREARAAGRLRHPGIVPVYGSGNEGGVLYFAMELIHGGSLAERIAAGTVAGEEAARITLDAARALSHAHDVGLVHRDIKPENVLVDRGGRARIADFGLVHESRAGNVTLSHCLLGTPSYVSPEQARGEPADPRWDVYGLGAVLYAMLTGRPPYAGDVPAAVLGRLLTEDPEAVSALNPMAPPQLVAICTRAMARDPQRRYGSAAELSDDLERFLAGDSPSTPPPRPRRPGRLAWGLAIAIALAAAGGLWLSQPWSRDGSSPEVSATPAAISARKVEALSLPPGLKSSPTLSPDGRWLAYASPVAGKWDLYLARLGEGTAVNLTAVRPGNHAQPSFSPDGRSLAFAWRRPVDGEREARSDMPAAYVVAVDLEERRFRQIGRGSQPSWSADGLEVAVVGRSGPRDLFPQYSPGLRVVNAAGGESRVLTGLDAVGPAWSPGGRWIAFVSDTGGQWDVWTIPAAGGEPTRVTSDAARDWSPAWAPDGRHLYFGSDRRGTPDVWRVAVDERTGRALEEPRRVSRGIAVSAFFLSADRRGRLAVLQADETLVGLALSFDPISGTVRADPRSFLPDLSISARFLDAGPRGRLFTYTTTTGEAEVLHLLDLEAMETVPLLRSRTPMAGPRWGPSGDRIALQLDTEIRTLRTSDRTLEPIAAGATDPTWSPDGRSLAVAGEDGRVLVFSTDLPGEPPEVLPSYPEDEVRFRPSSWSTDGARLAGTARGVVVYDFGQERYRRLTDHGERPVWVDGSSRLIFIEGNRIRRVDADTGEVRDVHSAAPNRLFPYLSLGPAADTIYFAVAGSDSQIYLLQPDPAP